jgi:protein-S-isoprenylcysteine O-methyltransferase Ste14
MNRPISSHALVLLQLAGVAGACLPVGWVNAGPVAGLGLVASGTVIGLITLYFNRPGNFSVYPELVPGWRLVTDGPYRWVRHPMYLALALMMIGIAIYNGHWSNYGAALAVIAAVVAKALREERYLLASSSEYAGYAQRTRRFIPFLI